MANTEKKSAPGKQVKPMDFKSLLSREEMIQVLWDIESRIALEKQVKNEVQQWEWIR